MAVIDAGPDQTDWPDTPGGTIASTCLGDARRSQTTGQWRSGAIRLLRRCPWVVPVLLVPSWITWLVVERDLEDTEHLLFYHIPDITRDPLAPLLNLTVTPLVNT